MKYSLIAALLAATAQAEITKNQAILISKGIFAGSLGSKDPTKDFQDCINDFGTIIFQAEGAYAEFAKKSEEGFLNGVKIIAGMTPKILLAAEQCKAMTEAEDLRLSKIAKIVQDPAKLTFVSVINFAKYKSEIIDDVNQGLDERAQDKYYWYGVDVGKAIGLLLLGKEKTLDVKETTLVAQEAPEDKVELIPVVDPMMPDPSDFVMLSLI